MAKKQESREWKVGDIVYPHATPQSAGIVVETHLRKDQLESQGIHPGSRAGKWLPADAHCVRIRTSYGDEYWTSEGLEDLRLHESNTRATADRHLARIRRLEQLSLED